VSFTSVTAYQALALLNWALIATLIVLLLLIARFYQKTSGKTTYYWVFGLPIVLFGVASVRGAFLNQLGGDPLSDSLWACGGAVLVVMCILLFRLMSDKAG
jgi:hypothetical protein